MLLLFFDFFAVTDVAFFEGRKLLNLGRLHGANSRTVTSEKNYAYFNRGLMIQCL